MCNYVIYKLSIVIRFARLNIVDPDRLAHVVLLDLINQLETYYETILRIIYSNINDSHIITMVQLFLDLRCSRVSWVLILYFDFDSCCLREVARRMIIEYNLTNLKVIE